MSIPLPLPSRDTREPTDVGAPASPKRLLLAVRYLWGDEGITTQLIEVVKHLRAREWKVGLVWGVSPDEHRQKETLSWLAAHTRAFYIPFPELSASVRTPARVIRAIRALKRVLSEWTPSVIHVHSLSLSPFFLPLRPFTRAPVVATAHAEPDRARTDVFVAGLLTRLLPRYLGDHFVAVSQTMKTAYADAFNVSASRTRVIPHGLDTTHFRPPSPAERDAARSFFGLAAEDRVVCLVGRLDPVKGHSVLFDALRRLSDDGLRVTALCAGEGGAFADRITAQATTAGVQDRVLFPGFCDPRTVYWASDVSVCPSHHEAFALVVVEAMLSGLVPIRTPAGGASEQIQDGQNGFLIPFNDPEALAGRMADLFRDDALRSRMAAAATTSARHSFGVAQSLDQLTAFYEDVQASSP
jgi:glycosyltransferase involved in cell wall biosynthesis